MEVFKKFKSSVYLAVFVFTALFFTCSCFANNISFEVSADRDKVALGDSIELQLKFYGTTNVAAPSLPSQEAFQLRYVGPSTSLSIINGRTSSSITHRYSLLPLKLGRFQIGPFSVSIDNEVYTSNNITIDAVEKVTQAGGSTGTTEKIQEPLNLSVRIFLKMELSKSKAYLNEVIPVTIKLYVNELPVRDINMPELEAEGISIEQFQSPKQYQQVINGVNYDVVEFKTSLFAARTGEFQLGPAYLNCTFLVKKSANKAPSVFGGFFGEDFFNDFFSSYQAYPLNLKSSVSDITVLLLPLEDKPAHFNGAIGDFTFTASAGPGKVKVGDPVTVKMTIRGEGNFHAIKSPQLVNHEKLKVYEPQSHKAEGEITFEQVVLPESETLTEIPKLCFSFFNPEKGQYQTIMQGPFPVEVLKSEEQEPPKIVEPAKQTKLGIHPQEEFGEDILYIKDSPGVLKRRHDCFYKKGGFWLFQLLPILFFSLVVWRSNRTKRLKSDIRYARRLHAPRKARAGIVKIEQLMKKNRRKEFYDMIFKITRDYLGDRFHLPAGAITGEGINRFLKDKNINQGILEKLGQVFKDCDMARYSPSEFEQENMQATFSKMREVIDYFEKSRI